MSPVNAIVHLFASDGQHLTAFCDNDGSFTMHGVPKGSHLLQAHLTQLYYPEVCYPGLEAMVPFESDF